MLPNIPSRGFFITQIKNKTRTSHWMKPNFINKHGASWRCFINHIQIETVNKSFTNYHIGHDTILFTASKFGLFRSFVNCLKLLFVAATF